MNKQLKLVELEAASPCGEPVNNLTTGPHDPSGESSPAVKNLTHGPCGPPEEPDIWADEDAVIIHEQPETAVYWNPYGQLVIRQRRWPEDDPCVVFSKASLKALQDAINREIASLGRHDK